MPYAIPKESASTTKKPARASPIVFVHEFSGDLRSWEAQMRYFSRRYRCIAFNARGYPPSEVPSSPVAVLAHASRPTTSRAVMRHLGIAKAHIIGCSMGALRDHHVRAALPAQRAAR